MSEFIETIIVGGGQAGLAISYYLKQEGREHLVLERAPAIANAWRNQRWDSFTLVTPNFQVRMPGAEYDGNDPYGFMSLREVVKYFDDYVQRYHLPVRCGVEVQGVEKYESVFQVRTTDRGYEVRDLGSRRKPCSLKPTMCWSCTRTGSRRRRAPEANRGERSGSKPCCEIAVTARPRKYSPAF